MSDELTQDEVALLNADRNSIEPVSEQKPEGVAEATKEVKEATKEVISENKETPKVPEGFVPHGALHEERARRKEIQKELIELKDKHARADERLKMLGENNGKVPEPTYDEDPLGYSKREIDRVKSQLEKVSNQDNLTELRGEVDRMRIQRSVERMESSFERETPDYKKALEFYAISRAESISEMGYEREEASELVRDEMASIVSKAIETGKNPAEVIYKMSKRAGFAAKEVSKETEKMDTLKKAESASRSLSDSGGKSRGEMTAEAIAEMSDDEFEKLSKADFKRAMGG